jgi:TPR repeat protein
LVKTFNNLNEIKELKAQAESGDINAQFRLGKDYHEFRAKEAKAAGLYWYKQAGSLGCARASYEAAMLLSLGTNKSRQEAISYFEKAVQQGNAEALFALSDRYVLNYEMAIFLSLGGNKSRQEAIPYFEKAVQQGNAEAFIALGDRYVLGDGVKIDPLKALSLYKTAGDRGNYYGHFLVGYAYYTGQVKPSGWNIVTGSVFDELWGRNAVDSQYSQLQIPIDEQRVLERAVEPLRNKYYRNSIKIPVDKKLAFEYFEKAAIAGEGGNYTQILRKLYIKEGGLVNQFKSLYWSWFGFFYELKSLEGLFYPDGHSPTRQKRDRDRDWEQRQSRC